MCEIILKCIFYHLSRSSEMQAALSKLVWSWLKILYFVVNKLIVLLISNICLLQFYRAEMQIMLFKKIGYAFLKRLMFAYLHT